MLTGQERIAFSQATAFWNNGNHLDEVAAMVDPDNVVETRETVAVFINANGTPQERLQTPTGELIVWNGVQGMKSRQHGSLYVMDFGEFRGAYFDGH
jgi:hypothetical protein